MIPYTPLERYKIIENTFQSEGNTLTIFELCQMASVSRSGFYKWRKNKEKAELREQKDQHDFQLILDSFNYRGYKKGARSIQMHLLRHDPPIKMNLKKIRRLMKKYKLFCPIRKVNPYAKMIRKSHENNTYPNLLERKFEEYGPRMVLLTDITYIPYKTKKDKVFAYLVTIIDACTKEVLSYEVSDNLREDFVLKAVNTLIEKHGVSLSALTLIHSDQGVHYTSIKFSELIRKSNIRQSMSRRGNCWDNAPQESFFGHMKDEVTDKIEKCHDIESIKEIIDDWIDYYNTERYQWQLAKLSPVEYYKYITTGEYPLEGIIEKPAIPEWKQMEIKEKE